MKPSREVPCTTTTTTATDNMSIAPSWIDEKLKQQSARLEQRIDERIQTLRDMFYDEFVHAFAEQTRHVNGHAMKHQREMATLTTRIVQMDQPRFNLSYRPHDQIRFPARIADNGTPSFPVRWPQTVRDFCRLKMRRKWLSTEFLAWSWLT